MLIVFVLDMLFCAVRYLDWSEKKPQKSRSGPRFLITINLSSYGCSLVISRTFVITFVICFLNKHVADSSFYESVPGGFCSVFLGCQTSHLECYISYTAAETRALRIISLLRGCFQIIQLSVQIDFKVALEL